MASFAFPFLAAPLVCYFHVWCLSLSFFCPLPLLSPCHHHRHHHDSIPHLNVICLLSHVIQFLLSPSPSPVIPLWVSFLFVTLFVCFPYFTPVSLCTCVASNECRTAVWLSRSMSLSVSRISVCVCICVCVFALWSSVSSSLCFLSSLCLSPSLSVPYPFCSPLSFLDGHVTYWTLSTNPTKPASSRVGIGDLFDMLLPMLVIYQEYVRNHHFSLQVLAECKQKDVFVKMLRRLEEKPVLQGRTLETFLTYPMHQVIRKDSFLVRREKTFGGDSVFGARNCLSNSSAAFLWFCISLLFHPLRLCNTQSLEFSVVVWGKEETEGVAKALWLYTVIIHNERER